MKTQYKLYWQIISIFGMLILLSGCAQQQEAPHAAMPAAEGPAVSKAICVLHPTEGHNVYGTVTFSAVEGGIQVVAHIEGLTPGKHGFHIHEYGDCSAPDGTAAGGHFNPTSDPHSAPTAAKRHAGDLGNVTADENGVAHLEWTDPHMTFSGANSIIGRGVIVHAGEDDLSSQPTGNAGGRVACGVIGIAKSQ